VCLKYVHTAESKQTTDADQNWEVTLKIAFVIGIESFKIWTQMTKSLVQVSEKVVMQISLWMKHEDEDTRWN